tara:strand:- start:127 stop:348 length:222 start_codon:yes stop_codon:yes gene_type:complete
MKHLNHTDILLEILDKLEGYAYESNNKHGLPAMVMTMGTYHEMVDLINDGLGSYQPGEVADGIEPNLPHDLFK